jgi:hypothetical protein
MIGDKSLQSSEWPGTLHAALALCDDAQAAKGMTVAPGPRAGRRWVRCSIRGSGVGKRSPCDGQVRGARTD